MNQRKVISEYAKRGAAIKPLGKMCSTCAFKLDSPANLEPHNVEAAHQCLAFYGEFNCHITTGVDKGVTCVGFLHAKQYLESKINNE